MLLRREVADDADQVLDVHGAAFPGPQERELVVSLRARREVIPRLCWVAEVDGGIAGSVVCSRGSLDGIAAVGLGPIGVLPRWQGRGIGSALVHAVIGAADATGEPLIALLGDPGYYGRFGFVAASTAGVAAPDPAWAGHFQVLTLSGFHPPVPGTFRYASAFDDL
jgi:putative acetyltransferase